jgi:hypothetical protein
LVVASDE